jgi:hypothetical protein
MSISRKKIGLLFLVIILIVIGSCVATISLLTTQPDSTNNEPVTQQTSEFASDNSVHVDHQATTDVIVDITGDAISDSAYFTVNTTNTGTAIPADATGHALSVDGATVVTYYDVKVSTNVTLTDNIKVKVTITNPTVNANSVMFYWNATQAKWIGLPTVFQTPHTVTATIPATALTGTPFAVTGGSGSTPTATPTATPTSPPKSPAASSPTATPTAAPTVGPTSVPTTTPPPTTETRHITINSAVGGTTNPAPGTYTTSGYPVIEVTTNPGYTFTRWDITVGSGSWSESPWNPCTVIYDYAIMTPVFTPDSGATPTPTGTVPVIVAPEYAWGPLAALAICFAALVALKVAGKANLKTNWKL